MKERKVSRFKKNILFLAAFNGIFHIFDSFIFVLFIQFCSTKVETWILNKIKASGDQVYENSMELNVMYLKLKSFQIKFLSHVV